MYTLVISNLCVCVSHVRIIFSGVLHYYQYRCEIENTHLHINTNGKLYICVCPFGSKDPLKLIRLSVAYRFDRINLKRIIANASSVCRIQIKNKQPLEFRTMAMHRVCICEWLQKSDRIFCFD